MNEFGNLSVILIDNYDFKSSQAAGFKGLAGLINNYGYLNQELGVINNYYVMVNFDYCINCCN